MEHKVLQVSCVYDKPGIILHVSHSHKSHDNTGHQPVSQNIPVFLWSTQLWAHMFSEDIKL